MTFDLPHAASLPQAQVHRGRRGRPGGAGAQNTLGRQHHTSGRKRRRSGETFTHRRSPVQRTEAELTGRNLQYTLPVLKHTHMQTDWHMEMNVRRKHTLPTNTLSTTYTLNFKKTLIDLLVLQRPIPIKLVRCIWLV